MIRFFKQSVFVLSGLMACSGVTAAVHTVPTQHANILNAFNAANTGDEIRVRKDYVEIETDLDLVGKNVTIRSYSMDYSTPESGAKWVGSALAGIYGKMARIENGSVTVQGFTELTGVDCNIFMMGNNSAVTIKDCILTGTKTADTAAVKSVYDATNHPNVNNVSITLENTTATANGRVIWTRDNTGTTNLNIKNCVFVDNSSYVVMWEPEEGTHNVNITDSKLEVPGTATAARNYRFLANSAGAGDLVTAHLNFDRNYFHSTTRGRASINLGGILPATYDPASTLTATIRNCVFDLTKGPDANDSVSFSSEGNSSVRKADIKMEHCTIIFGGSLQSGIRLDENQSTLEVSNCIFDADGAGLVAYRSLRGKTISNNNLIYVAGDPANGNVQHQVFSGGSVGYSGNEIIGESAQFNNRTGKDFTLAATSPAVEAGEDLGVTVDIRGNARPNPTGTLPDLGAYERAPNPASVNDWAVY